MSLPGCSQPPPPDLLEGVARFNAGAFYEAHEVWEDLWLRNRSPARPFLQALIQIAAAYHHRETGRERAFQALLREASGRLAPFAPMALLRVGMSAACSSNRGRWSARGTA